jgi:dual 3',5'-cyclic-AMP and -GMP phosphodiesterase 11
VNVVDAYEDHRFDRSVDDGKDFKHKTILCMPIKNSKGHTIGVIQVINSILCKLMNNLIPTFIIFISFFFVSQLVNKFNNLPFTQNDENFVEAFSIFCGMGIYNTTMY